MLGSALSHIHVMCYSTWRSTDLATLLSFSVVPVDLFNFPMTLTLS